MVSFDEFEELVKEELQLLPEYVHRDLNGGVLIDPAAYLHPARIEDDLYILGTYTHGGIMGKQIVLYYGSFAAAMPGAGAEAVRMQVRGTLRHEFLHHLETQAGLYWKGTLIEEDRDNMIRYYMRHGALHEMENGE